MSGTSDRNWLNTAEYVSIACSAAGSVAAVISQQLVYAIAPMTLAMSLSLANRQRFQQQIEQQTTVISNVRQEAQFLNNKVQSLPSVKQFSVLEASVTKVEQIILNIDTEQKVDALVEAFNNRPELEEIGSLHEAVSSLRDRLVELSSATTPFDPSSLILQVAALSERLDKLPLTVFQQQLTEVKDLVENLDASSADLHDSTRNLDRMQQDLKTLQLITCSLEEKTTQLESRIDKFDLIGQQLDNLQQLTAGYIKAEDFESLRVKLSQDLASQIETTIDERVAEINILLKEIQPKYEYRLVCDRDQSQQVFLKSLLQTQSRLILVCPWLTEYVISADTIQKFKVILNKNGQIDVGWGHLSDTRLNRPKQMTRHEFLRLVRNKAYKSSSDKLWNYTLSDLERLEQEYPQLFRLKLLGTHEKFLVCDREWAMLGSHNFLTSSDQSQEREVGLWTNDPYIIDKLIKRFDEAKNLEKQPVHLTVAS